MATRELGSAAQAESKGAAAEPSGVYVKRPGQGHFGRQSMAPLSIEKEFEALSVLYGVAPGLVARPLGIVHEGGQAVGYSMERVNGLSVYDALGKWAVAEADDGAVDSALRGIARYARDVTMKGYVHGDLNRQNVMLEMSGGRLTGGVKIIDPRAMQDSPGKKELLERDLAGLRRVVGEILVERGIMGEAKERYIKDIGFPAAT